MRAQFSNDNSPVELELLSGHLLFCDPLYFQSIIDGYSQLDFSTASSERELIKNIETKIFPFGGGGLLGYRYVDSKLKTYRFDPLGLKKWNTDNKDQYLLAQQKQITTLGLDTSSFLIIDCQNIEKLINAISYNNLVDALLANELDKYFQTVNNQIGNKAWVYVIGKTIDNGGGFDGDGYYILE